jgi:glycosyltransferase involved in cell wall biosynthesis
MKLVSVVMVYNESDIILNFIKHTLSFSDYLIIFDDNSNDGTDHLIEEMLISYNDRIRFIKNASIIRSDQIEIMNNLVHDAINEIGADFVLPLDCDEFLVSDNETNVREILYNLNPSKNYYYHWKTITFFNNNKNDFNSNKPLYYRVSPFISEPIKVIVSAQSFVDYSLTLSRGNHTLLDAGNIVDVDEAKGLYLLHYPIRSLEQIVSKALRFVLKSKTSGGYLREPINNLILELYLTDKLNYSALRNLSLLYGETYLLNYFRLKKLPETLRSDTSIRFSNNISRNSLGILPSMIETIREFGYVIQYKEITYQNEHEIKRKIFEIIKSDSSLLAQLEFLCKSKSVLESLRKLKRLIYYKMNEKRIINFLTSNTGE